MKISHIALCVALAFVVSACAQTKDVNSSTKMTAEQMLAKKKAKAAKAAKQQASIKSNTDATLGAYEKYKKAAASKKAKSSGKAAKAAKQQASIKSNTDATLGAYEKYKKAAASKKAKSSGKAAKAAKQQASIKSNTNATLSAYKKFKMGQAKKLPSSYTLYFDFNSAAIGDEANAELKKAVYKIKNTKTIRVVVAGHTDTSGNKGYNRILADKRVKAVDSALRKAGVNWLIIEPAAMGEKNPAEKTGDSVKNFQNRRVVIDIK
jgi:outer membrane protein OmpA-like peptidoglycan-associated protein